MSEQQIMKKAEESLYKTYNRFPVVFDHGEGVKLFDVEGREYLDFGAGIAVMGLGYNDPEFTDAVKEQLGKLLHTSNLFYSEPTADAAALLLKASGMDKVFFTNSGTEAIEGVLKIARRYHYNKIHEAAGSAADTGTSGNDSGDTDAIGEIIAMKHSFHGRSLGALSVTGNDHYQDPFKPLIPGIRFAEFNNLESIQSLITGNTCAIILEPIQGEGGIYPADPVFLKGVRDLCDKHDILLIFDEIQCGMGRTGSMFAWQNYGVKPDMLTVAKALGNGLPVGAFLACGKAATALIPGDHGSTYGGNPLTGAGANAVLSIYQKRRIPQHAEEIGNYLWDRLEELKDSFDFIVDHRGIGLMQGLEFSIPVGPIVSDALLKEHLILISAANNTVRFVPPLVITEADVDEMIEKLKMVLGCY